MEHVKAGKGSFLGLDCWLGVGWREKGAARAADGSSHCETGKPGRGGLPGLWDIQGDML